MKLWIRLIVLLAVLCSCAFFDSLPAQGNVLDQDDVVLVDSVGTNRICFHRNTFVVDTLRPLIINRIKLAVAEIGRIVPVRAVEFRVLVFPERTLPEKGMSGVAPNEEHIYILLNPRHPRLYQSLSEEMVAVIAHEYHHTLRNRTVGPNTNLFESIISEGLAEHFCTKVTGEEPPWADQIPVAELAPWWAKAEKEWFNPDYDYLAWFIGLNSDIPRGTGYSIGRSIIRDYLAANPEERPSTLYGTVANKFLPFSGVPLQD